MLSASNESLPQSMLLPSSDTLLPQSMLSLSTPELLPQRIELPHNMEEPHKIESLPSTEEPLTAMTMFPLAFIVTVGDKALPTVAGARLVLANAAWMSK